MPPTDTTGGNGGVPGAGSPSGDADASSPVPVGLSCTFAVSPSPFTLPVIGGVPAPAFPQRSGSVACTTGTAKLTYELDDVDADGQRDLVVTTACDDPTIGVSAWLVYVGSATGFAATPVRYALPPQSPAGCATTAILDVTGDYIADYVVTSLCTDGTVGTSRWLVYPGGAGGFASVAVPYALPLGASPGAFAATGRLTPSCTATASLPAFQVLDLDGDAKVDLVITQSCDDATVGTTAWLVYAGQGSGASPTATRFTLPTTPAVTAGAFVTVDGALSCTGATRPSYGLIDVDADGKLDMVVSQTCGDATVGTTEWLLYRNGGQGFTAAPASIALPALPGAPAGSFTSFGVSRDCTGGAPSYALVDGNADGRLDLLVTRDCADSLTGVSYWELFTSNGANFAPTARKLGLPAALGGTTAQPLQLTGALQCTGGTRPAFAAAYSGLTLDLVETAACSDPSVGSTRWLVYGATCP